MPQLSPVSWVLVSFFALVSVVSVGVKLWWDGGVTAYQVAVPLNVDKVFGSRLFAWKS
uniref:ATP synthase F0 subunit 8 n=1 Tax=Venustaconcha ellipsiformis TaxID=301928 RepID=D2DW14_VENEL|nr:ATP synthase F0 subunit 8 [Venustaconcha ellipsiformis]ACQ91031.1 ATP synthase F0 subunit 8 [Venustaconcha ellipsiformis]